MTASSSRSEGRSRGLWRARLAGVAAGVLVIWTLALTGSGVVSRPVFDAWQRLAPRPIDDANVAVVWIDEESIRAIGPWPWPRYVLARLTERIAAAQPRVIGFDMIFPEEDRIGPPQFAALYPELSDAARAELLALPSLDAAFGRVIGRAPVVLARAGIDAPPDPAAQPLAVEARFSASVPEGVASWPRALANIPAIDDVALGHGLINAEPDSDGVVRRVPMVARVVGAANSGFALELARVALGEAELELTTMGGRLREVRLGPHAFPTNPDGTIRVPFGTLPARANHSALDVLGPASPAAALRDRVVIVGLSGAGTADVVATPLAAKIYGAAVQAAVTDAILVGASLSRPWWSRAAELALAGLLGAVAVFALPRLRPTAGVALTVAIGGAVLLASFLAFRQAGLLLDPALPLLVAAGAGAVTLMQLFSEGRRDQRRLEAALQQQRLAAARAAGELNAARDIQLGMLPPRHSLAALHGAVELDALIEPARSVGGDFFDAFALDEHRLCFLVGDVTGKGVPAALFMALSKALAKSVLLRQDGDLGAAMTRLSHDIARDNREDMFVTMLAALLDTRSGRLLLCNAGHEDAFRIDPGGAVSELACDGGPPLAVAPELAYVAEAIDLAPGDSVVIVSDGITEAQDPEGSILGRARAAVALAAWGNRGAIDGATACLLAEVRNFEAGGEPTDDVTALAFRFGGRPSG